MVELEYVKNGDISVCKVLSDGVEAGVIEYKSFWNEMPYISLIKLLPEYRRKGIGSKALGLLEKKLKNSGYKAVLTSTRADEDAQHFYRKTGYKECGCLILEDTLKQPMEMFFIKVL